MNRHQLKHLNVRIPCWIDSTNEIAKRHSLNPDRLRAITNQFFLSWIRIKRMEKVPGYEIDNKMKGYFPVHSKILKLIGGKGYARYVQALVNEKIIRKLTNARGNDCYEVGKHSKLFSWIGLDEKWSTQRAFRFERVTDYCCIKAILKTHDIFQKHVNYKTHLPEEMVGVINQLKAFTNEILILPLPDKPFDGDEKGINLAFMQALANGEIGWNTVDGFGERYHNPLTVIPKEYRKYLRFKGREDTPLVILDFSNSQPYFSSIVGNGDLLQKLLPEFLPLTQTFHTANEKEDYRLYQQLCCEGLIYEYFPLDRDIVKIRMFSSVLFAKKQLRSKEDREFKNQFRKLFPTVVDIAHRLRKFNEFDLPGLKEIINPIGKKRKYHGTNDSHKIMSCMMQRTESRIMFRHIVPEMIKQGIQQFLTIHDSFILLPEHEQQVRQIIADVFDSLGVSAPKVKREQL